MTWVLQRYKLIIIISALILSALLLTWFVSSKQNANKIPSRGVFVIESHMDCELL